MNVNTQINTVSQTIEELVSELADKAMIKDIKVATAESCTGGGIGATITELAGSSSWFEGGIISYSNTCKQQLLGVPEELLKKFGAVSGEVVVAMVAGILIRTKAQIGVAVSGIAGPEGGSDEKPIGTVWIAWKKDKFPAIKEKFQFSGNRAEVRQKTIIESLKGLITLF